uniref:Uncharacterized protein n=1 Tax=Romanomermis culicivorax TaxID=13658 RepID=A0A915JJJ8_ROMCU
MLQTKYRLIIRNSTCSTLKQLNTTTARITNTVPTLQTIDQIMGAISDQLQAQQLQVQHKIKEQAQVTNAQFAAFTEQIQQPFFHFHDRSCITQQPTDAQATAGEFT